jgi:hypothetical protein
LSRKAPKNRRNPVLALIKSFRIDRHGARLEFLGGHVVEYRCESEVEPVTALPPRTIVTTGVAVDTRPALAKCRSNVLPLRKVG